MSNIVPRIINDAFADLQCDKWDSKFQILFGGSGSGKSVNKLGQQIPLDMLMGGRNYLICRQTGRSNTLSTFTEIQNGISELLSEDQMKLVKINKSNMSITFHNGHQILFVGLLDVEKIKSIRPKKGVITDIVIEEATEIQYDSFKLLLKRMRGICMYPKRMVLIFNPVSKGHWIYREFFQKQWLEHPATQITNILNMFTNKIQDSDVALTHAQLAEETDDAEIKRIELAKCLHAIGVDQFTLREDNKEIKIRVVRYRRNGIMLPHELETIYMKSMYEGQGLEIGKFTYIDNMFLDKGDIIGYENESYDFAYDVYSRGNFGIVGKLVYNPNNITQADIHDVRRGCRTLFCGKDFGFNDPSVTILMSYDKVTNVVYVYDEMYRSGLNIEEDARLTKVMLGLDRHVPIYCDCADPSSISSLNSMGLNAISQSKPKDGIPWGIRFLNTASIVIDRKCVNTIREFSMYQYKKNPNGGYFEVPVDRDNHAMDAIRYGILRYKNEIDYKFDRRTI